MKIAIRLGFVVLAMSAAVLTGRAQQPPPMAKPEAAPTIASVMEVQLKIVEGQVVPAAEAMPEDKYSFAPSNGEYQGVRTFAQQLKHIAATNLVFYSSILGQAPPTGVNLAGVANGPDDIRTKAQIVKYVKESFALGHQAIASLTAQNLVTPLVNPPIPLMNTRLAMASFSCSHSFDHYGQIAEYLRMNGILPPGSKGQPPANPAGPPK